MEYLHTLILGAVQGLAEFIPISSSAHLIIIPWVLGWKAQGLVIDVSFHFGTLLALLVYFWRDWYEIVVGYFHTTRFSKQPAGREAFLLWPVVFACIPAALVGKIFESKADLYFRNQPVLIALMLIGMGMLLFAADKLGKKKRPMQSVSMKDWVVIGLAQALAIIPGVSRSGITITAGLLCGLDREAAARFSFLLGAPIIFGAALLEMPHLFNEHLSANQIGSIIIGIASAAIVGYICIGFLIQYLKKRSMDLFVIYRIVIGVGLLLAQTMGWLRI